MTETSVVINVESMRMTLQEFCSWFKLKPLLDQGDPFREAKNTIHINL